MRKPDENYDWTNAVGKYAITGNTYFWRAEIEPRHFVLIEKATAKTVFIKYDSSGRATRMDKSGILFVEANGVDYERVKAAWEKRQAFILQATADADAIYLSAVDELLTP